MPSLKDLSNRIASVRSTRKITAAMKMVAASKLRRAEEQAIAMRSFATSFEDMTARAARSIAAGSAATSLLLDAGSTPQANPGAGRVRIVLITTDRGLCGGLNPSLIRETRRCIHDLLADRAEVSLTCLGGKGHDALKRDHNSRIVHTRTGLARPHPRYEDSAGLADGLIEELQAGAFDRVLLISPRFVSILTQEVVCEQIAPFILPPEPEPAQMAQPTLELEPGEEMLSEEILPFRARVRLYLGMIECFACEQGARVTAMDNATRNAGEMIDRLTLQYNRARQSAVTNELIEIISGAEAL